MFHDCSCTGMGLFRVFQADVGALHQEDVMFVWLKCQAGQEPCGCSRAVLNSRQFTPPFPGFVSSGSVPC